MSFNRAIRQSKYTLVAPVLNAVVQPQRAEDHGELPSDVLLCGSRVAWPWKTPQWLIQGVYEVQYVKTTKIQTAMFDPIF